MFRFLNFIILTALSILHGYAWSWLYQAVGGTEYPKIILYVTWVIVSAIGLAANYIVWLSHVEVYVSQVEE
jgi:hypothetical protein